ncbi:protein mono-ADP-ribosyltransferase PARP6-like [Saccostrea echinata]|uniref:protein mono-ADP-ribosyltransferase PARP6-like n=1 Tax=Saccostrea echinata TaxID=191078 RepID=UPI002A7FE9EC|nr:protein mono-ADP-ribosyltransferase PARP6-like [Saccostrea echinata]
MTLRQQKFAEDVNSAIALCEEYDWPFTDFHQTDNSLSFVLVKDNCKQPVTICISEDYPENTLITRPDNPDHSEHSNDTIKHIIMNLNRVLNNNVERSESMETDESYYEDCQAELNSDCDDDEEEDTMDDYYQLSEDTNEDVEINPVLALDMEKLTGCYGDHVMDYRTFESINEIDIEIRIFLSSLLEKEVLDAWNLDCLQPLVIRINLSMSTYLDVPSPPKLQVLHSSKSGIVSQLQKILTTFVNEQWPRVSNSLLQQMFEEAEQKSQATSADNAAVTSYDKNIARLMEMGFTANQAITSLLHNNGDIVRALEFLMDNKGRIEGLTNKAPDDESSTSSASSKNVLYSRQASVPLSKKRIKKFSRLHSVESKSLISDQEIIDLTEDEDNLTQVATSSWFGKNSKRIPSPNLGFLVQIYQYARQRLPTLNEFCVVCDDAHVFQNGAMLKPSVCSRELCVFAFQTLGVMADAAESVATGAQVVDLLVAMTRAACNSPRKDAIFTPYPTVVDPNCSTELALNPKSKDYDLVKRILGCIPPTEQLAKTDSSNIKKGLDTQNKLAYPLLQWIISSNRSHIVKLPKERCLEFMRTPHQYLLLNSPPAKEKVFRELKKNHGSTFAFHGSSIENWHSIIREGLIVASGTKLQVNGAAYGKGIYLSPHSSTSFGYSRMGYGYQKQKSAVSESHFLDHGVSMTCIALCEVITHPSLKKSGSIWVSPESDYVCTRFFFVYESGQRGEDVDTQKKQYIDPIMAAVNYRA